MSQQAISKVLNAAHRDIVRKGEQIVQRLLNELGTRQRDAGMSKPDMVVKEK